MGFVTSFYAGGLNLDKGQIDFCSVYDFDYPYKLAKVSNLKKICTDIFEELAIENDFVVETKRDDFNKTTNYTLFSQNICQYLLSIGYREAIWQDNLMSFFIRLVKPTVGILPIAYLERLEFLSGAYLSDRTENEGEWRFFNNIKKVNMVLDFLHTLADEDDVINTISYFRTPHVHRVQLNTDGDLWEAIRSRIL